MGQHHPDTGALLFLHRTMAKYKDADTYINKIGPSVAWTHIASQESFGSWFLTMRDELPAAFFMGDSLAVQQECVQAFGKERVVTVVPAVVRRTEKKCLAFLEDLANLPFYPKNRVCTEESMFFCKHP
jgi:hypothetical protein